MSKKIELRVQIRGEKCKPNIMTTVAKVQGVKSMSMDSEKGILTIIGTVDVVEVVKKLKKAKIPAEVISVGPEKPPEKKDEKKDGDKKKCEIKHECGCKPHTPCNCYCHQQPSYDMPPPPTFPQVVFYDQSPYGNNCTIF